MGVLVHGVGVLFYQFDNFVVGGPHVVIECIARTLKKLHRERSKLHASSLYVQADNKASDNKNKYMLAFLSDLVERDIFKSAEINFLMKGHTHTDIDQIFGWISEELKKYDGVPTREDYIAVFESALRDKQHKLMCFEEISRCPDWKVMCTYACTTTLLVLTLIYYIK
jgi:hypothetical protein